MSRLFLSHSSHDNFEAIALQGWLLQEGWDDLFLDLDPARGIAAGERWERVLYQAAGRCDAVLFLVSQHWLDSDWCLKEFRLAHRLNKRLLGLLIEPLDTTALPEELSATWQLVNLAGGPPRPWKASRCRPTASHPCPAGPTRTSSKDRPGGSHRAPDPCASSRP